MSGASCLCPTMAGKEIRGPYKASPAIPRLHRPTPSRPTVPGPPPAPFVWYWFCTQCGCGGRRATDYEVTHHYRDVPDEDRWVDEVSTAFAKPWV